MEENYYKLLDEYKKFAKDSNKRILNIERKYGKDSWAVKKLKQRLDSDLARKRLD